MLYQRLLSITGANISLHLSYLTLKWKKKIMQVLMEPGKGFILLEFPPNHRI